uniref:Thioredoxin domain-containing protein n=1 Tax=Chromera velia CCMP2878 TaxID=1169474 RepID=A0A0G4HAH2_9ALVE|mmetsp:Transcript_20594/g.41156  ORF Transcript_20594/g.41156 Transcript_20594/m.41156 type:complete len:213 (-) Transcript_20594:485-1123(-)|eukprot:Cvel_6090.t1-p1 / transcript=Cvel_6090.t1 / gene=Cvel_6090 / organism=Chromera_velia_CCMP2878 / gene_product=Thioredoxin, putative / transcript_product=Thioredoxin, putative / location=Cvel_scaffold293:64533-65168(-) / protein_length=212 / sequence_SO=supercontig / SO=protein_coding / is_pseudo=false
MAKRQGTYRLRLLPVSLSPFLLVVLLSLSGTVLPRRCFAFSLYGRSLSRLEGWGPARVGALPDEVGGDSSVSLGRQGHGRTSATVLCMEQDDYSGPPPSDFMGAVEDEDELFDLIEENPGKTVVVRYWAVWCRSCKQQRPLFEKIAEEFVSKEAPVLFVEMDFDSNSSFARESGVKTLPVAQIWKSPDGPEETIRCPSSKINDLKDAIEKVT